MPTASDNQLLTPFKKALKGVGFNFWEIYPNLDLGYFLTSFGKRAVHLSRFRTDCLEKAPNSRLHEVRKNSKI
jgi:hypothetical protein